MERGRVSAQDLEITLPSSILMYLHTHLHSLFHSPLAWKSSKVVSLQISFLLLFIVEFQDEDQLSFVCMGHFPNVLFPFSTLYVQHTALS